MSLSIQHSFKNKWSELNFVKSVFVEQTRQKILISIQNSAFRTFESVFKWSKESHNNVFCLVFFYSLSQSDGAAFLSKVYKFWYSKATKVWRNPSVSVNL
jgi:hypothetical protein